MNKKFIFYWANGYSKISEGPDVHSAALNGKLGSDPNGEHLFFEDISNDKEPRFIWNQTNLKWDLTKKASDELAKELASSNI